MSVCTQHSGCGAGHPRVVARGHSSPYLAVMEGLGTDGQAAQLDRLLEASWDPQPLQLLVGMASQFVCPKSSALLCQGK